MYDVLLTLVAFFHLPPAPFFCSFASTINRLGAVVPAHFAATFASMMCRPFAASP
ncbi:hypothetical protein AB8B12_21485 [Streptomyces sp. PGLac3x]